LLNIVESVHWYFNLNLVLRKHKKEILIKRPRIELKQVSKASEGIKLTQSENLDLTIDIYLSDMDGITTSKKLKKILVANIFPVIVITADAMDSDIEKTIHLGFRS
jgi:DNA-binding NarL/FixJ family response regulator